MLRALRRLKRRHQLPSDLRLLILGKGPLERRCKHLAKPLGEQVQFVGFTDRVSDYLGASDALITASHAEGLPPVSYTHLDVYKRQRYRSLLR